MTPPPPPGWEDILDPGEEILWQGRPEARFNWAGLIHFRTLMGVTCIIFALFWMSAVSGVNGGPPFPVNLLFILFGLPVLLMGLSMCFGASLGQWLRLRGSFYTLTNRNAFIATEILGRRRLERFPLNSGLFPALEEGLPGSVWFTARAWNQASLARGSLLGFAHRVGFFGEKVGFEEIAEARTVYRLFLDAMHAPAT